MRRPITGLLLPSRAAAARLRPLPQYPQATPGLVTGADHQTIGKRAGETTPTLPE